MKTKILIVFIEKHLHESLLKSKLKNLAEKYEVIIASTAIDALDKIAQAKLIENSPIRGLVFERNTLASNRDRCKVICQFAETYSDKLITAINMIYDDQDSDARDCAVSANYCKSGDWKQVENIFENHFKK